MNKRQLYLELSQAEINNNNAMGANSELSIQLRMPTKLIEKSNNNQINNKMENKKSKVVSVKPSVASKVAGKWFTYVKLEDGTDCSFWFSGSECPLKKGDTIEYQLEGEVGKQRIKLINTIETIQEVVKAFVPASSSNLKIEALKMAISSFNAGKIAEDRIRPMTKHLFDILSE